jgi:hypothetical protein
MLRDMLPDISNGFINVPTEYLSDRHIGTLDARSLRPWVTARVRTAREYFRQARDFIRALSVLLCRIAADLHCAPFELLLDLIERDDFYLRTAY